MSALHASTPPGSYIASEAVPFRRAMITLAIGMLGATLLVLGCPGRIDSQPIHVEMGAMVP